MTDVMRRTKQALVQPLARVSIGAGLLLVGVIASGGIIRVVLLLLLGAFLTLLCQDFWRRAGLRVEIEEADAHAVVVAPALPPWPIDVERIITNELAAARGLAEATRKLSTSLASMTISGPFTGPPSSRDLDGATARFEEDLDGYAGDLRDWLEDYSSAAHDRARTFKFTVAVSNSNRGAYAEAVRLAFELPEGVSVAEEDYLAVVLDAPPERPQYVQPRPQQMFPGEVSYGMSSWPRGFDLRIPAGISLDARAVKRVGTPIWETSSDGRTLEILLADLHSNQTARIDEPLLLIAEHPGRYEVTWTIRSKSSRSEAHGHCALDLPHGGDRPAFGRLHGIMRYPDVAIDRASDDDSSESTEPLAARTSDPQLDAPQVPKDSDLLEYLPDMTALMDWQALGLDPATDGESTVVRVDAARRREDTTSRDKSARVPGRTS